MPRQLRLEDQGAVYHVMARGDRRELIYHDDHDRLAWIDYLGQVCRRTGWRVYGWVLMGNHYHLLMETPEANLVSGMRWLQTAYTGWFNRRHDLSGHLFGGRYKAVLIDEGGAGIVGRGTGKSLLDYRWSSLTGAYLCSPRERPQWANVERAFSVFGLKDSAAGRRQFLERLELREREERTRTCGAELPEGQSLQSTLRRGWYFGSQAFRERLLALLPNSDRNTRLDQEQHYEAAALMRDAAEQKAETIFIRQLRTTGVTERELKNRPRSDPLKWKIARTIQNGNHCLPQVDRGAA